MQIRKCGQCCRMFADHEGSVNYNKKTAKCPRCGEHLHLVDDPEAECPLIEDDEES